MADISNLSQFLTDVATAIREKKGTEEQIPAANFDTEIKSIEAGGSGPISQEEYNSLTEQTRKIAPLESNTIDSNTKLLFHCESYSDEIISSELIPGNSSRVSIQPNGRFGSCLKTAKSNVGKVTCTEKSIIDYINTGSDYTLDFWAKLDATVTDWASMAAIGTGSKSGNFFLHCFANDTVSFTLKMYAKDAATEEQEIPVVLTYNDWHHIAIVKKSMNYTLFADGKLIGTANFNTSYNEVEHIIFGSIVGYSIYNIIEYIDEIRFSDIARYEKDFVVPNAPYGQAIEDDRTLQEAVNDIDYEKQNYILPENIKQGLIIFGVTGSLKPGIDTSDANATADDILMNKTAYINGEKITGTLPLFPNSRTFVVDNAGVTDNTEDSTLDLTTINVTKQVLDNNVNMKFSAPYSDITTAIGLTADKIKSGETILGITGTYTGETTE